MRTYEQHGRLKVGATIVFALVIGGTVVTSDKLKIANPTVGAALPSSSSSDSTAQSSVSSPAISSSGSSSGTYKNGTFSATSSYRVPHGEESVQVSLTLTNGIVTGASIQNSENDGTSASYQEDFASSYKSQVVGKSISSLALDVIAGASDTTQGFNDAVSQISTEAKA